MSRNVTLLLADPDARVVDGDGVRWVVSGLRSERLARALEDESETAAAEGAIATIAEDAVVLRVAPGNRVPVTAYRSATASRSLYYTERDGRLVVTDHFRNALASVPVAERTVPGTTLTDHLLFRSPIEPKTYLEGVYALPQGAKVAWDGETARRSRFDRLDGDRTLDPDHASDAVDDHLREVLDIIDAPGTATMFSGGVDSTLVQSYLDDTPAMCWTLDSPEFEREVEYAEAGADRVGASLRRHDLAEADLLEHLEASVEAMGTPGQYYQSVLTDAALRRDDAHQYVNADYADTLFGLPETRAARIATWLDPVVAPRRMRPLEAVVPGPLRSQFDALLTTNERVNRPPEHPESFAQYYATFPLTDHVAAVRDERAVRERCHEQVGYVRDRVATLPGGTFDRQVTLRHLLSFFGADVIDQWRQLAYAHGKTVEAPFRARSLVECARAIPAGKRYVRYQRGGLRPKAHLKSLLAERVPDYPVDQPKGAGILPFERYYESGAFADVFERYDPPAFVASEGAKFLDDPDTVTWGLVTYAVWRDRVLENPGVETVRGTRRYEW